MLTQTILYSCKNHTYYVPKLTPNIVFCNPNGIGVNRVNKTTLNALGPDITRNMARPVSFLINLQ